MDYLITLFTNAPTLGGATPPVTIFDGPAVTGLDAFLKLYVGLTDPDNIANGEPGATSQQTWGALGRFGRNEQVTIHCCAEAWSGYEGTPTTAEATSGIQTMRLAATGITAAVEALMQADTTQFGGNVLMPDPGLTNVSLPQTSTTAGILVRQTFDLIFRCRIGGF
jgi:hypothetical protein